MARSVNAVIFPMLMKLPFTGEGHVWHCETTVDDLQGVECFSCFIAANISRFSIVSANAVILVLFVFLTTGMKDWEAQTKLYSSYDRCLVESCCILKTLRSKIFRFPYKSLICA